MRTPDLVNRDLSRHLTDLDHQESQERAVDEWLEQATPFELAELVTERMPNNAKFWRCLRSLLTDMDTGWREQVKGVIGEQLQKEAAETEAADLA